MIIVIVVAAVGGLLGTVATLRASRRKILNRIRAEWGAPSVRDRKMDAIRKSHRSRLDAVGASGSSLDDRTWDDLNLDDVFDIVDRTESTLGQHTLYHRLRSAPVADHLDMFDALTTRMSSDTPSREHAQIALARLQDLNGYDLWWLLRTDALGTPSWYAVFPFLTAVLLLLLLLSLVQVGGVVPVMLAALGVNVVVGLSTINHIVAVGPTFRQLAPLIATAQALTFLDSDDIEPLVGAIRVEVPRLALLKAIARWVTDNPLMISLDAALPAVAVSDFCRAVYEYLNLAFLLDWNAVYFGAPRLRTDAPRLLRVIAAMGEIDAAISVASFRAGSSGWTRPRFCEPGTPVLMNGIRHPLIRQAVPNDIQLGPPHGVLVTGSNMSGKSTFLRTIGVSTVLAQTINTCLATDYNAPVLRVRSCIGRADDLLAGKSYYLVEVEALLALVRASGERTPHLFLLDELFRGTNAVERIAAGEAVLRELIVDGSAYKPHIVLAATHDGELVDLLRGRYAACHFGDAIGPNGLTFDYHLLPGPATTRNAITLLQLEGAPESLVNCALARAAALDHERRTISSESRDP